MLIKRFVVFLFSLFLFLNGFAQKATIYGTISDYFNHPLFGASVSVFGKPIGTTTDEDGKYSLDIPVNISLKIIISFTGLSSDSIIVKLSEGERRILSKSLKENIFQMRDVTIEDRSFKSENIKTLNPKVVRYLPTPNQSVEDLLKTMPGVSSANELSSTYSVRGGNYDENLVYINDFEVYRPLLIRSGQQEGLSVINPDMVEGINFSAEDSMLFMVISFLPFWI